MKIALFGATGGTGKAIVEQGLGQGHQFQLLVRSPEKVTLSDDNLTIIQGDVRETDKVAACVQGADAVIISLGNTSNNPDMIVSTGTRHIVAAMKQAGIRRAVVVTSLGIGDSINQVPLAFKMIMKTVLKKAVADKEEQEKIIRQSGLDWTIVRPGGLTDEPATGRYRAGTDASITAGRVSRADVAAFVLAQLTSDTYLHQTPAIS